MTNTTQNTIQICDFNNNQLTAEVLKQDGIYAILKVEDLRFAALIEDDNIHTQSDWQGEILSYEEMLNSHRLVDVTIYG